jgi:hypothetical protein
LAGRANIGQLNAFIVGVINRAGQVELEAHLEALTILYMHSFPPC